LLRALGFGRFIQKPRMQLFQLRASTREAEPIALSVPYAHGTPRPEPARTFAPSAASRFAAASRKRRSSAVAAARS
jgi:hypothetical protein